MNENKNNAVWWILGIIVIALIIWALWSYSGSSTGSSADATAAAQVVTGFGGQLQDVSLLAPTASSTIATAYAPYVDPTLLASWEANPSTAPGRQTSSPWPDHIEVTSTTHNGAGYDVAGTIVLMTSTGNAGQVPFTATVSSENGGWYITAFSMGTPTS